MLVLLLLLLVFIIWMLVTPMIFRIDTESGVMSFKIWGLGQASLIWIEREPVLVLHIFWWKKRLYPYTWKKKTEQEEKPSKEKKRKKRSGYFTFRRARKLLKSFRVKEFRLNLDTEDVILNAYLFPFFYFLNRKNIHTTINYKTGCTVSFQPLFFEFLKPKLTQSWISILITFSTK